MTGGRSRALIGVIEGGGTKFVCAVGESATTLVDRTVIPTTDPVTTLGECLRYFQAESERHGALAALGIACFGPLQLRPEVPEYGCLLSTPKPAWSGVNVVAPFRDALGVPVVLDTDVGAAAAGELQLGAGRGRGSLAYVTVGTGIGGAVAPTAGRHLLHPEMGHLAVRRDDRDSAFAGICPFHGDCLEGLASGPAVRARWGCDLAELPAAHAGRSIIAGYIGQLAAAIALLHSPEVLVLGGGVMADGALLPPVRDAARSWLGGYLQPLRDSAQLAAFIRPPALGSDAALAGAALMALDFVHTGSERR